MNFQQITEKLIEAKTESARKFLLKSVSEANFLKLAQALRDTYYESWTNEPKRIQKAAQVLKSLAKLNPTGEITALSFWVSGIAALTEGKLFLAVENLDKSAEIFQAINKEYESAQTQVGKLYALALLGKYDEAIECGANALKIFEKYDDNLAAGKIEMNLGNIVSRNELHYQAGKFYHSAHNRFLALNEIGWLTMCENGLAITYSAFNDFRTAEKFYAQALSRAREAKMFVTEAEIEASMGNLALFRGRLDEALKYLELSRRKYEILRMPHQTATAELEIADIYLELNLTEEAFSIYEQVTKKLGKLKMQGEEARARANFGRVAILRNETAAARRQLKKSARLYALEKNKTGAAAVKLTQANLELIRGDYKTALSIVEEAEKLLSASENLRYKLTARWLRAEALRKSGEDTKAENLLAQVFADSIRHEQPLTAQSAQIALGEIALERRNYRRAERHFKRAIALIETLRSPLAAEEFRMAFLANKLAPFENLAKIYLAENKLQKAFSMVEKARARVLAENLGGNFNRVDSKEIPANLQKKLKNLREELNWFYSRLNRAEESEIENLQTEAARREKEIADVMRQIESTRPSDAKVSARRANFSGQTSTSESETFKSLQNLLGKRKALIEYVNFDGVLSAFVVTDEKIYYAAGLAKETEILSLLESLRFQFGALRYGAENLGGFINELKTRADFYLRKLYEKLVAPLEKYIEDRALTIVPVGATHYVPFHALFDGARYLIETRETIYAPSATVWQFLASKPRRKHENALLIGYADERVPLVAREIESLKKIFRPSKSCTGKRASVAAFMKNAPHFDILHLACHGQFRPENPMFSSLHLADGWLTVRDICSQKLNADLVILSACETGLNKIYAGDEILGLARGFLSAGASSLILSLWTVNDAATAKLMKGFYECLEEGKTISESLRIAQCRFIKKKTHPYFWSPFALIGR
ncbi:MAG: CHAT domain-containing protein [Pyrinomonadaceae bacterium]